ncbi:radical SAM protein [Candidatus Omnitrophota bacterium]
MSDPKFIQLHTAGELKKRCNELYNILESCELCARRCKVNRAKGEVGFCHSTVDLKISNIGPHFGEEPELVGKRGSGTVFITNCNLGCVYCQNYDISHLGEGEIVSPPELALKMLYLQNSGCHNINFVTPTHFIPQIVEAIDRACEDGLSVPLVYNCGGYENSNVIKLLEGIFDIYMPDVKYSDCIKSKEYSSAEDYFQVVKESAKEMHRQVGDLLVQDGIAQRGLLIRHLVLPNGVAGSREALRFIAEEISKDTYVNIMDQYRPLYNADKYEEINRFPTAEEFNSVLEIAREFGLHRGFNYE